MLKYYEKLVAFIIIFQIFYIIVIMAWPMTTHPNPPPSQGGMSQLIFKLLNQVQVFLQAHLFIYFKSTSAYLFFWWSLIDKYINVPT